ncbi:unnamed protein product [Orchesella dallaii]|uniref:Uncharacterized protein n=1 Tax=Orchesella dallaii TaxID=48710 RepID=A0ABP1RBB0_9HEXA
MYKWHIAAFVVVVGMQAILFGIATAQDEIACRGVDLNMTAEQKAQVTDCLAENGIKSVWKIPVEKLSCFGVCILKKKKLLTAAGKLDHDKILNYIMDVMKPDEVKVPLKDGTEKCMKEHGDKVEGNNDPKCMTFMEVGQCVHDVFFDVCID